MEGGSAEGNGGMREEAPEIPGFLGQGSFVSVSARTGNDLAGSEWCWNHDPARAEERSRNASHAAKSKHSSVAKELREVRELIWELLGVLLSDNLPLSVRKRLTEIVQLLQCYLRAAELEMRAAEEPLKLGLNGALKAVSSN